MSNNLSVKVTADVVDLQTKFAVARAEVAGLSTEINKLARASASGLIDPANQARLQQVAGDFAAAKTQAASLGGALYQASGGVLGFSSRMGEAQQSVSTTAREIRKLFTEIQAGSAGGADVTLLRLGQHLLGLGPAALVGIAGVAGLVAGLGYLIAKSIEAGKALDQAELGAQFAGNLSISRQAIEQFANEMAQAKNISSSDAREIAASLASIPGITLPTFHALTAEISDFAQVTGKDGPKAAEELAKVFNAKTSAAEFARSLGGITQAQINMAEQADLAGDAVKEQEVKLQLLVNTLGRSTTTIDQHNARVNASASNALLYAAAVSEGISVEDIQTGLLEQSNKARQQQLDILRQTATQLRASQQSPDQTLQAGVKVAEQENPVAKQIDEAKAKIAEMNAALAIAQQTGQQISIDKLTAGLAKAKEELSALQFGPALEQMRADMAQVAAAWDGTQSGMLAKQIQIAQAELANTQQSEKQKLEVKTEIARLEVQLRQATASEAIAEAHNEVTAINGETSLGAIQRLERERDVWVQVLANDRVMGAQRLEAAREFNQDYSAIARETASETQAIARINADSDIAISRLKLEAEKQTLDASVAATQAAVNQKYTALKGLADRESALDLQALQNELALYPQQSAEYAKVCAQIAELKQKLVNELATLDRQEAADARNVAKEQASDWKNAVGEIMGAESGLVSDLLNKRKSLSASLLSIGANLITQEIANDLKAVTARLLIEEGAETQKKAIEQGGVLYHLFSQAQQTADTGQAQVAQTAAVNAGNAARVSSDAAAAAASKGAGAAQGGAMVMADAAKAFSGTYASVSQIPYVGWILAPAAAAAAFAAVAAYEGLASLDVGTNLVPHDMPAMLHKGEAVVPRAYNPAAGGSPGGGGGFGGGDVHNHWHISAFDGASVENLVNSQGFRDMVARSFSRYVNRGGRG